MPDTKEQDLFKELETEELLSRGLDADLDRQEMRKLYRLAAQDADIPARMGHMVETEEALNQLGRELTHAAPKLDMADAIVSTITRERIESGAADSGPHPVVQLWHWIRRAHRMHFQPLSFGSGLVAAGVAIFLLQSPPVVERILPGVNAPRLEVSDIAFKQLEAQVDWTNRFILLPGHTTRMALRERATRSVVVQLESMEPVPVNLTHNAPGLGVDLSRELVVDGIRMVTLRNPRAGDEMQIENTGKVPVVVHTRSSGTNAAVIETAEHSHTRM
ncbi:hypothetical protein [Magnetococcus sp. PR-3]|uniref:hypothetical protein n=1 Tax=Magnetococcus sp. PR-3 TaxID=3120355 RepID=UPI002FCE1F70